MVNAVSGAAVVIAQRLPPGWRFDCSCFQPQQFAGTDKTPQMADLTDATPPTSTRCARPVEAPSTLDLTDTSRQAGPLRFGSMTPARQEGSRTTPASSSRGRGRPRKDSPSIQSHHIASARVRACACLFADVRVCKVTSFFEMYVCAPAAVLTELGSIPSSVINSTRP